MEILRGVFSLPWRTYTRMVCFYGAFHAIVALHSRVFPLFGPDLSKLPLEWRVGSGWIAAWTFQQLLHSMASGCAILACLEPNSRSVTLLLRVLRRLPAIFGARLVLALGFVVGALACLLPGLFVLSLPVLTVMLAEDRPVFAAIRRAYEMSRGARSTLLILSVAGFASSIVPKQLLQASTEAVTSYVRPDTAANLVTGLTWMLNSLSAPVFIGVGPAFYRLRTRSRPSAATIAETFA